MHIEVKVGSYVTIVGGFINVYSEVGKGTTFRIYLPAIETEMQKGEEEKLEKDKLAKIESTRAQAILPKPYTAEKLLRAILETEFSFETVSCKIYIPPP